MGSGELGKFVNKPFPTRPISLNFQKLRDWSQTLLVSGKII